MNLGISNSQVSTWKRIKAQHIVAAAGVALAVSAVIGGLSLRNDSAAPVATSTGGSAATIRPLQEGKSFIYAVASQAEATALQAGFNEAAQLEAGDLTYRHILVVDSIEAEAGLQVLHGELAQISGAESVYFVDLRAGAPAPAVFGATTSEPAPSMYPLVQEISNP